MWLLQNAVRQQIDAARRAGMTPSAEQLAQFEASHFSPEASGALSDHRIATVAGNTAEIAIKGILTPEKDWLAMIFGGGNTTYKEIISALSVAATDDTIENIILDIDSPGGSISGMFDAIAAIEAMDKPVEARVSNMAASAAYALASQADTITATSRAASFGSIGIAANVITDESMVTITSTEAPKKRPDVTTEEGVAMVREELDAHHEIFVDAIAAGRGTTIEKVNAEFGQGAMLLASEAHKRGMIDSVGKTTLKAVETKALTTAKGGNKLETGKMDLNTLMAQHPATYSAAVEKGIEQERERVATHLMAGETSGDMKTALACIEDGTEMTMKLQTKYMMAAANRNSIEARAGDDASAADGVSGEDATKEAAIADAIMSKAAENCGVELGA